MGAWDEQIPDLSAQEAHSELIMSKWRHQLQQPSLVQTFPRRMALAPHTEALQTGLQAGNVVEQIECQGHAGRVDFHVAAEPQGQLGPAQGGTVKRQSCGAEPLACSTPSNTQVMTYSSGAWQAWHNSTRVRWISSATTGELVSCVLGLRV